MRYIPNIILVASLLTLSSQIAYAAGIATAPGEVSGKGCAIGQDTTTLTINLTGNQIQKNHGYLNAGATIDESVTFNYDLASLIDSNCPINRYTMSIIDKADTKTGPITLTSGPKFESSTSDFTSTSIDLPARTGTFTVKVGYTVNEPTNKLAEEFTYKHTFTLQVKAKAGGA